CSSSCDRQGRGDRIMNATAVIVIAVGAAIVLGALAFTTLARRSDVRGAGALSQETVRRDIAARAARPADAATTAAPTAASVEAVGVEGRTCVALEPIETDTGLTTWTPPDLDALGVCRSQFFIRATISLMGAGLGTFGAAAMIAFLWPTRTGGFGGK